MMMVAICCFNRPDNLARWLRAWKKMDTTDAKLMFVLTSRITPPSGVPYIRFPNAGMDIGALQRFLWMPYEWDRLFWCPDDMIPMRPDLLRHYTTADLVGTYWAHHWQYPMMRSGGFCITRDVGNLLEFPPNLLTTISKEECFRFEFKDYNFYSQVTKMPGKTIMMADGTIPPNSPTWDEKSDQDYLFDIGHKNLLTEESRLRHIRRFIQWTNDETVPMPML